MDLPIEVGEKVARRVRREEEPGESRESHEDEPWRRALHSEASRQLRWTGVKVRQASLSTGMQ